MEFFLINDVQQYLNRKVFGGGPWLHLATIKTPPAMIGPGATVPEREYICLKNIKDNKIYIEQLDLYHPTILKKIKDDNLWNDLAEFLTQKGILSFGVNKEFKIAKKN